MEEHLERLPFAPGPAARGSSGGATSLLVVSERPADVRWLRDVFSAGPRRWRVASVADGPRGAAALAAGGYDVCAASVGLAPSVLGAGAAPVVVLSDPDERDDARRLVACGAWDHLLRGEDADLLAAAGRAAALVEARSPARGEAGSPGADLADALGTLAAGAAHGVNTSLTGALASLGIARHVALTLRNTLRACEAVDVGAVTEALDAALDAMQGARDGIDGAALVARGVGHLGVGAGAPGGVGDLGRLLDEAMAVVRTVARQRAEVVREPGAAPMPVDDVARVSRLVLLALFGVVRGLPEQGERRARVTVAAGADGDVVWARVEADRGSAPPADDVAPAAWTRGCGAIAASLGGALDVTTAPDGPRVTLRLPWAGASSGVRPRPAADARAGAATGRRRGRVLIVDDEPVLLDLMARILRRDHAVVATTRPAEALERVERGEAFDVILCDMMMPGMTGEALHGRLATAAPEMARRVVFLTAGVFSEPAQAFLARGEVPWFEKPIDPDDLRAIVSARVEG